MLVHPDGCREATSIVEDLGVVVHHFAELLSKALSVGCFPAVSKESLPHFMGIAVNLFIGAVCSEFLRGKVNQFGKKLESLIETSE